MQPCVQGLTAWSVLLHVPVAIKIPPSSPACMPAVTACLALVLQTPAGIGSSPSMTHVNANNTPLHVSSNGLPYSCSHTLTLLFSHSHTLVLTLSHSLVFNMYRYWLKSFHEQELLPLRGTSRDPFNGMDIDRTLFGESPQNTTPTSSHTHCVVSPQSTHNQQRSIKWHGH
jgi:hypothetical protein